MTANTFRWIIDDNIHIRRIVGLQTSHRHVCLTNKFHFISFEVRRVSVDPEMHFTWFVLDACIRMCYGVAKELLLVNGLFDICPGRCGESWCGDGANGCKHGVVDSTSVIEEGTDDFLGKLDPCRIGTRIIPPRITCTPIPHHPNRTML